LISDIQAQKLFACLVHIVADYEKLFLLLLPVLLEHRPYTAHAKGTTAGIMGTGIQEFYFLPLSTYHMKYEALCNAVFSFITAVMSAIKPHKFSSPVLVL